LPGFLAAGGLDKNKTGLITPVPGWQKLRRTSLTAAGTRIVNKAKDSAPASVHSVTLTNHTAER